MKIELPIEIDADFECMIIQQMTLFREFSI